jgi:hypothetical protein
MWIMHDLMLEEALETKYHQIMVSCAGSHEIKGTALFLANVVLNAGVATGRGKLLCRFFYMLLSYLQSKLAKLQRAGRGH